MENQYQREQSHEHKKNLKAGLLPAEDEVSRIVASMMEDISWLEKLIDTRIEEIEDPGKTPIAFSQYPVPTFSNEDNPYASLVKQHGLGAAERLLLTAAVIQQVSPEIFTKRLRDNNQHIKLKFPEFGGYIDVIFTNFVPTLQTVLFLLAGNDKTNAAYYKLSLTRYGKLINEGILRLAPLIQGADESNELLFVPTITEEYLFYFQSGKKPRPDYGRAFPATWITTNLDWDHLVLSQRTSNEIREVMRWVEHGQKLTGLSKLFNPSYSCLFYGPPGTGKSLTAKLIGKKFNKDVFRVDLSMIVSKYVGETEKNLAHLFDRAENKDWILFFDEADSLFSKRTGISDANDKWANLEVSYLLQRMEDHKGLCILATNLRDNIDNAMTRRFQKIIYFPLPKQEERMVLWKNLLPETFAYHPSINLKKLAAYEFSGANISNIIKDVCLCAVENNSSQIEAQWLSDSIANELMKEKRTP